MTTEYVPGKATIDYVNRMKGRMRLEDDFIVFTVANEYNIPLKDCKTVEGILKWVGHLAEKTWIDKDDLVAFILLACDANGLSIPGLTQNS